MSRQMPAAAPRGLTFLRTAIALQTLTLFFQAVTAGMLLTSPWPGRCTTSDRA